MFIFCDVLEGVVAGLRMLGSGRGKEAQVRTYLIGDLGQLRDRDGLVVVSGSVMGSTSSLLHETGTSDVPTREWCPRQPL